MDFFQQLSLLAKTVENDVTEIQSKVEDSSNNRYMMNEEEKEDLVGKAVLVARDVQKDVKDLKKKMRSTKETLEDDSGFMKLVAISQTLVKKQAERLEQIEQHMQKYGYQPLAIVNQPNNVLQSKKLNGTKLSEKENKRTEVCENGENEENQCEAIDEKCVENESDTNTPEKCPLNSTDDVIKTPKLEDFGLSKDLLDYYKKLGEEVRMQMISEKKDDTVFKSNVMPSAPSNNISETPPRKTDIYDQSVPAYFDHMGLVPTPGFTGGRDRINTEEQYDGLPSETPLLLKSRSNTKSSEMQINKSGNEDSFTIPSPPIMCTPGFKQLPKHEINKAIPVPCFILNVSDDTSSPIPPVLQTPGIKQISRSYEITSEKNCRTENLNDFLSDEEINIPNPPILCTPGIKQCQKNWAQDSSSDPKMPVLLSSESDLDIPDMPELTFSWTDLESIKSQYENAQKSAKQNKMETTSTDFAPQLASHHSKVPHHTMSAFSTATMMNRKSDRKFEDSPVPAMPELTGTYNFNMPYSEAKDYCVDKENIVPSTDLLKKSVISIRLDNITQSEYDSQPDYVTRLLSLQLLNKTVDIMENLFSEQADAGKMVCVSESDLQPVLGKRTMSVLLVMMRLGRLKQNYNKGHESSYAPV